MNMGESSLKFWLRSAASALVIWTGTYFFCSYTLKIAGLEVTDNVGYLSWALSTACVYYYSRKCEPGRRAFFGSSLIAADTPVMIGVLVASILLSVSSWALLVYIGSNIDIDFAIEHWGLVSDKVFRKIRWPVSSLICNFLTAAVLVPVSEEVFFRGFLIKALTRDKKRLGAVIWSALIFGILHINKNFLGAFIDRVLLGMLAVRTSSLYGPILVHGLHNLITTATSLFLGYSVKVEVPLLRNPSYWHFEMACGVVGVSILIGLRFAGPWLQGSENT